MDLGNQPQTNPLGLQRNVGKVQGVSPRNRG